MRYADETVQVGDTVSYTDRKEFTGLVVERVCDEYVRVLWDGMSFATICRRSILATIGQRACCVH